MTIRLNNYARPSGISQKGAQYYRWRVFVDEPERTMYSIKRVIYTLHPTFPNPTQIREDAGSRFALETTGWGEFNILVTVKFKDGHEEILEYPLDLSKPWPTETASA